MLAIAEDIKQEPMVWANAWFHFRSLARLLAPQAKLMYIHGSIRTQATGRLLEMSKQNVETERLQLVTRTKSERRYGQYSGGRIAHDCWPSVLHTMLVGGATSKNDYTSGRSMIHLPRPQHGRDRVEMRWPTGSLQAQSSVRARLDFGRPRKEQHANIPCWLMIAQNAKIMTQKHHAPPQSKWASETSQLG